MKTALFLHLDIEDEARIMIEKIFYGYTLGMLINTGFTGLDKKYQFEQKTRFDLVVMAIANFIPLKEEGAKLVLEKIVEKNTNNIIIITYPHADFIDFNSCHFSQRFPLTVKEPELKQAIDSLFKKNSD